MEYKVTGNIQHDGKSYVEGDTLTLSEAKAAPLIAIGVLEDPNPQPEVNEEARPPKKDKKGKSGGAPEVGGERAETGEPSIDGPGDQPKSEAQDVTPVVETGDAIDPSAGL